MDWLSQNQEKSCFRTRISSNWNLVSCSAPWSKWKTPWWSTWTMRAVRAIPRWRSALNLSSFKALLSHTAPPIVICSVCALLTRRLWIKGSVTTPNLRIATQEPICTCLPSSMIWATWTVRWTSWNQEASRLSIYLQWQTSRTYSPTFWSTTTQSYWSRTREKICFLCLKLSCALEPFKSKESIWLSGS